MIQAGLRLWCTTRTSVGSHERRLGDRSPDSKGENAMTLGELLVLLVVAGICGTLAQSIAGYSRGGCLVSIALGFVGLLLVGLVAANLVRPTQFLNFVLYKGASIYMLLAMMVFILGGI